jgi:hypothetical protein
MEDAMSQKRKPDSATNDEATAGQQESRDTGSLGDSPQSAGDPPPLQPGDAAGRQAYDRSGKKTRDFKRSGQIHSDTQDRV